MCNGLYWVCTHSGNMDDENMNVFVIFFTDNNESCESLWNKMNSLSDHKGVARPLFSVFGISLAFLITIL